MAIASLVCGIFSFLLPAAIIAVILGHLSRSEIRRSVNTLHGKGLALAGLILGYAGIAALPLLFVAAVMIPGLHFSQQRSNEAYAVGALRSYNYAMGAYAAKCPKIGFPKSLANLGMGRGDCQRAELLDDSLGVEEPVKAGYTFHYAAAEPDNLGRVTRFSLTADPVKPDKTGTRHFYTDQTEIIRWSEDGPADASSPVLK